MKKNMFKKQPKGNGCFAFDEEVVAIKRTLNPCPVCGEEAEILAVHKGMHKLTIERAGCVHCHLVVERQWDVISEQSPKLLSKRFKSEVNVVEMWNRLAWKEPSLIPDLQDNVSHQLQLKCIVTENGLSQKAIAEISTEEWQNLDKDLETCE